MSKGRFLLPAFLLLIVSAFALAACGSGESDEDKVTGVIETASTSTDPADCEATSTVAFMEQSASGKEGKEAVEDCEEDAEDDTGDPDSVEVSEVEVEGEEASATVAFTGGSLDSQTVVINLVEEDGDWKVDELESFVDFDREALVGAFEESLGEVEGVTPELSECVIEGIEEFSDTEFEETVLEGSQAIEEIVQGCAE